MTAIRTINGASRGTGLVIFSIVIAVCLELSGETFCNPIDEISHTYSSLISTSTAIAINQTATSRPQRPKFTNRPNYRAKLGTIWIYEIEVETDLPPVSFELEQGPPGMTLSPEGTLAWWVDAEPNPRPMVAIIVADANGEKAMFSFHLVIETEDGTVLSPTPPYRNTYRTQRTWEFNGPGYTGDLLQIIDGPDGVYFVFDMPMKENRIPRNAVLVRYEDRIIPGTLRVISTAELRSNREKLPENKIFGRPNLPPYDFMVAWEPIDASDFVANEENPLNFKISVDFKNGLDPKKLD